MNSSGIGLAAAKTFASKGMKVFLADIDADLLESARKQVEAVAAGGEVEAMVVDVSKLDDVVALRDKVMELWGEVSDVHFRRGMDAEVVDRSRS